MADKRKLQGEIDRCLKRVAEGVETFEDVWQKVHNAANANQKEKYEADLKKEIKKLQRLRDQIKTWLTSNDIKDKKPLMENRRLIETQMERFKIVERETKTKAYSKEGLGLAVKVDPAQREKEETRQWLTDSIEKLTMQIDLYESEIESVYIGTKKKKLDRDKADKVEELQGWVERHKFHIQKMETIMRLMDNCSLETDQVKEIQDDLNYYIDSHEEPDFAENELIYDDLELEEASIYGPTVLASGTSTHQAVNEEEINSIATSPSASSQGPLSPKTPTTMKSTSQELFEERRRGKTQASSTSSDTNEPPLYLPPQPQPQPVVPQSPRRPGSKSLLQNSTLPSRGGSVSGSGKITTPTSSGKGIPPTSPTKSSSNGQGHRGASKPAQPPSGPAYALAASGHQNSTLPLTTSANSTTSQTMATVAPQAQSSSPPLALSQPSPTTSIPAPITITTTSSSSASCSTNSTSSSSPSGSSTTSQPQPSLQPAANSSQPRPQGPGSHHSQHSRSSSGSSSLSFNTLSQESQSGLPQPPPPPSPGITAVPESLPVTSVASNSSSGGAAALAQQSQGVPTTSDPGAITVETGHTSPSTESSAFSPGGLGSQESPPTSASPPLTQPQLSAGTLSWTTASETVPTVAPPLTSSVSSSASSFPLGLGGSSLPTWMAPTTVTASSFSTTGLLTSVTPGSLVPSLGTSAVAPHLSPAPFTSTLTFSFPSTSTTAPSLQTSAGFAPSEPSPATSESSQQSLSSLKTMAAEVVAASNLTTDSKFEATDNPLRRKDAHRLLDFSVLLDSTVPGPGARLEGVAQTRTDTQLQPLLGVTPLGPMQLSPERQYQLKMLEAACRHLPLPSDSERVRPYLQRTPYPTPYYHHQHPPPHFDSFEFFQRLSIETLFFIFYYMEGTKAQYMAAKALKKLSWRFHTKYMMWFQRLEEPKAITDDYEMGTYIYFDFEKWSQRKKEGFTFEYRYLEDKDLP